MYKLNIEFDAQNDLLAMRKGVGESGRYASFILALLQEIKGNQVLLGSLLDHFLSRIKNLMLVVFRASGEIAMSGD